jgi:hypothetical protein
MILQEQKCNSCTVKCQLFIFSSNFNKITDIKNIVTLIDESPLNLRDSFVEGFSVLVSNIKDITFLSFEQCSFSPLNYESIN